MLDSIIDMINQYTSFLITSHVRLDGDALGSELALYHMLSDAGKNVAVYNQDETPANYCFLPGADSIVHKLPALERFDVVFALDCSELDRIGDESSRIGKMGRIINIDHHISNDKFGAVVYIDDQASSTAELIYRLMLKMNIVMTKDIASNLYAAILTDTGGFCYGNTKKESLFTAGNLVESGADPQWISENIYESNSPVKIKLLTKVLESLAFDWDRKVGYMVVSRKDLEYAGAREEHSEGFVDIPRSVKGVDVSILFTELSEHQYKLSFRSKGKVNIEPVAKAFGGGGHMNAAACQINGYFNAALHQALTAIKDLAITS